eukprot:g2552.t1
MPAGGAALLAAAAILLTGTHANKVADSGSNPEVSTLFNEIDVDGDGKLNWKEIKAEFFFKKAEDRRQKALAKQFQRVDTDGSGSLTTAEIAAFMRRAKQPNEERIKQETEKKFPFFDAIVVDPADESSTLDFSEYKAMQYPFAELSLDRQRAWCMVKAVDDMSLITEGSDSSKFSLDDYLAFEGVNSGDREKFGHWDKSDRGYEKHIRKEFEQYDANGDGWVDVDEYMEWHFGHLLEPNDPIDLKLAHIMVRIYRRI